MKKVTFDRRKIRMSLEGWYFTFVLMFIGTAAILRRANLLLILAAMLTAPILLNWRFVMASLRNLIIKRRTPKYAVAGQVFHVSMTVGNESRMDSWQVQIDETVLLSSQNAGLSVEVVIDRVPLKDQTTRTYECLLSHRGVYELQPTVVSTSYPLGLVRASAKVANKETLLVGPPLGTLSSGWLEWTSQEEVDELHAYRQPGILDGMFHGVREYRQGDSRRSIHWRSTAKLGKPAVKQFEKQGNRELNLVADLYDSQSASGNDFCEAALSLIFSLTEIACSGESCQINLLVVGERCELVRGQSSPHLRQQIIRCLAKATPASNQNLEQKLKDFVPFVDPRNQIVVASSRPPVLDHPLPKTNRLGLPEFLVQSSHFREAHCLWMDASDKSFSSYFELPPQLKPNASENGTPPLSENRKSKTKHSPREAKQREQTFAGSEQ